MMIVYFQIISAHNGCPIFKHPYCYDFDVNNHLFSNDFKCTCFRS